MSVSFVIAFLAGVLVGAVYVGIRVKSPAPPVVALLGLASMWLTQSVLERLA
jgi:XapX domain-containing protein